ncbi:MAG: O-antigen ligase family protein [Solirubrobacteraceae bacterium]
MFAHAAPASAAGRARALVADATERCGLSVAIAVAIVLACFYATGGLFISSATTTEMVLTIGSGALIVAAILQERARSMRIWGAGAAAAFLALAAYSALSTGWSAEPSYSWIEGGRTFAYAAAFGGSVALVRLAGGRWRSVLAGVVLATAFISLYALGTKVFPGAPGIGITYARLNAPFGYWNFVGLTAAVGLPGALWLGARREGHGLLVALTPPLVCLSLVTIMLSYSRGALLAAIVGLVFWFVFVPLRLRSAALLLIGAAGALIVVAWTFSQSALTTDYDPGSAGNLPWSQYVSEGHDLGWLLLVVLLACAAGGLLLRFAALRNPPSAHLRRRLGQGAVVCVALVPVVVVIGLAASSRGLTGSISHGVSTLTNTNVSVPNDASRLTALGSERAVYWRDAIDAFDANPLFGLGAGSYQITHARYDTAPIDVTQAHGYIFQTLADLGLAGLLLSLLLAGAWVVAALRAVGPLRVRSESGPLESAERIGLLTLTTTVIVFAVHSLFDFDWFVPGAMMIPLLCGGWLAGRGPLTSAPGAGRLRPGLLRSDPWRGSALAAAVALTLLVAWVQWQPLRSYDAYSNAEVALGNHQYRLARAEAEAAVNENPLDYQPLVVLAEVEFDMHRERAAYATMVRAVRLQPSNPITWYDLANFDYEDLDAPIAALAALRPALFLDPQSTQTQDGGELYTELLPAQVAPRHTKHRASRHHSRHR